MKKISVLLFVLILIIVPVTMSFKDQLINNDYWFTFITEHFDNYILKYPQQKVYLHLDREEYETGSTIWYKAYVFDDSKKIPDSRTKNLYIELISPTKQTIMNRLLKIENGVAQGDFPVQDTIGTGLYLIRAFTNSMRNSDKDYLFSKEIRIVNSEKVYYSNDLRRLAKKNNRRDDEIDFQFFPEGGVLVDNLTTMLAFKAIDNNGMGLDISGEIYSDKGKLICEIITSHLGMGQIEFTPHLNEKYKAHIKTANGKEWKFNLPEVIDKGYVMNVKDKGESFHVLIQTNKEFVADPVSRTAYIFIQNGGKIYYKEKLQFENNLINLDIDKKYFPSGIVHFTIFDGHGIPQCERLAFVNHETFLKIKTNFDSKTVGKRDKIELEILVTNSNNEPVTADLSLSVKNRTLQTGMIGNSMNIKNYFLLQADLKGNIENPEYYFSNDPKNLKDLDILMLTQGWRKFLWQDILKDSIPDSPYPPETDLRITGRITKYLFDISVKDAEITMTMLNHFNDVFNTISGEKGRFEFLGLEYYDTMDVLIEARTKYERKNILILVEEALPPGNDFNAFKSFYKDSLIIKRKLPYEKYKEPEEDPNKPKDFKLYSNPDQVVKFDNPTYSTYPNVMEALKGRVPGLQVNRNGAVIRGPNSFLGSSEPLYLIDGMETDYTGIQSVSVNDIDHVDILKGPSAAIYGIRGANGVIAVYTKKGFYYKRGEIRFKMLGYHTPKVFYSPKYDAKNMNWDFKDLRRTVFWKPDIKTDREGKAHVSFYQSDIADKFDIIIEGMSKKGQFGFYRYDYVVE